MKSLKRFLVFMISLSLVLPPGSKSYVRACDYDYEPYDEDKYDEMPVYNEGFRSNNEAYKGDGEEMPEPEPPPEPPEPSEPEPEPEEPPEPEPEPEQDLSVTENTENELEASPGRKITLGNGTVLTNTAAFSYNDDGTMPDGIEFTDQNGNKWITKDGNFQQQGFAAKTISIPLKNSSVLTNATPFDFNADGTTPVGTLFTDQNGNLWVSEAGGIFSTWDTSKTLVSSLPVAQKLQGLNAKDGAALLAQCDPAIAKMLLGVASDQQAKDIFKEMDADKVASILNLNMKVVDPYARVMKRENIPNVMFNEIADPRLTGISAGLDAVKSAEVLFSEKIGVDMGILVALGASIDVWNALPSDRAAAIVNSLLKLGISGGGQGLSGGDENGIPPNPDGTPRAPGLPSINPDDQKWSNSGTPTRYDLSPIEVERIKAMSGILASMDPAKAAALLDSDQISLTNAAKLMLLVGGSIVVAYDESGPIYESVGPKDVIFAALAKLDPDRAQSLKEVGAYLGTIQSNNWNGGYVRTPAANLYAQLTAVDRPLTTVEKWANSVGDVTTLSLEDAAKLFNFLGNTAAAEVLGRNTLTVDKASEILGKLGTEKTTSILAGMDKTNAIKADSLRVKIGIDPDLSPMTPDAKATYLAGLDPAKAAVKLQGMGNANQIAEILASDKMTTEQASKIIVAMINRVTTVTPVLVWNDQSESTVATGQTTTTIDMSLVAQILSWKSTNEAATFKGLAADKAAAILLGLGMKRAVLVFNNDKMSVESVGAILTAALKANGQTASNILFMLDKANKTKADQVRALIGAVPGQMNPDASAVYLTTLDPKVAAAELTKLKIDEAATILASTRMNPAAAANILKGMAAGQVAGYITNANMSVEAATAILTKLKISDGFRFTEIMANLALDVNNKDKVAKITTEVNKVPSATMVSSTEQTRLKAIYGFAPTFSTKETTIDATTGTKDAWKYYDQYGRLIGTRIDTNTLRSYYDGEYGMQSDYGGGPGATYYDINGKVLATSGGGGLQRLSADQANSLTDLFQAKVVYTNTSNYKSYAGGTSSGTTNYYDENFNLIGSENWSTSFMGYDRGFVTFSQGYLDRNGNKIMIGTANGPYSVNPTGPTTRSITAGSAEEQGLLSIFGVAPAMARDFTKAINATRIVKSGGGSGSQEYSQSDSITSWGDSGPITTYYDKDGNLLGSKTTTYGSTFYGELTSADHWYDKNGNEILW